MGSEDGMQYADDRRLGELVALLDKAETENRECVDLLQRVQADFVNYKRRVEEEREERARMASAQVIERLLPVLDDIERAIEAAPGAENEAEWVQGVALVHKKLMSVLEQDGLKQVEAEGKQFDPREHEAVAVETRDDAAEDTVTRVVQQGYSLNGRLLRPARVVVAK